MGECCVLVCSTSPVRWADAFGTSACLSAKWLLRIRIALAVVFVTNLLYTMINQVFFTGVGLYFFIYLTHWSLILETVYAVTLVFTTQRAQTYTGFERAGPDDTLDESQPVLISVQTALFMVAQPVSLLVVLLFWVLDQPFWNLCAIKGSEPCYDFPTYISVFVHGINWVLLLTSFLLGNIPFYLKNSAWAFIYAFTYMVWSYLHFLLKIGKPEVQACSDYPLDECPIYGVLDWHHFGQTFLLALIIILVVFPVFICIYWGIGKLRDHVINAAAN